jgi:hypothetical protein
MPGCGAAVDAGGSSHWNLADIACLAGALSLVNQKTEAPKTKMIALAIDHWINFMTTL